MDPNIEYCRQSVSRSDYQAYLISLMMPARLRPLLWTLGAFRILIESIPDTVSDPTLGFMRLTWWRDQIGLLENGNYAKGQPILAALKSCILSPPSSQGREVGREGQLLIDFINEQEAAIENSSARPAAYAQLLEKILRSDYPRYLRLETEASRLAEKYRGTKWETRPPLLALRLWWAGLF